MSYNPMSAATVVPPGVTPVAGVQGVSTDYARADHTHKTSVQKDRVTVTVASGTTPTLVTWTYPSAFPAGTVPIVLAVAQNTSTATQAVTVNVVTGTETATSCQFIVFKSQSTTLGGTLSALLGAIITPLAPAPTGTIINCQAGISTLTG